MEKYNYTVNYRVVFDIGDGLVTEKSGILKADHEVTEEELRTWDWGIDGDIISLQFTSVLEGVE